MTKEEQALEIGKMVIDLKDNRRKLVCLKSKAKEYVDKLEEAIKVLKQGHGGIPVEVYRHAPGGPEIDHEAHWVTAESINTLLREIEETSSKISDQEKA